MIPEPCPRCGWQYGEATLADARFGRVQLDPLPTHLCEPSQPERSYASVTETATSAPSSLRSNDDER